MGLLFFVRRIYKGYNEEESENPSVKARRHPIKFGIKRTALFIFFQPVERRPPMDGKRCEVSK